MKRGASKELMRADVMPTAWNRIKQNLILFIGFGFILSAAPVCEATTYTFEPAFPFLWYLEHEHHYTWGISWEDKPEGQAIVGASLLVKGLFDWENGENALFIHQINLISDSRLIGTSDPPWHDAVDAMDDDFLRWPGEHEWLTTYHDRVGGYYEAEDFLYAFPAAQIQTLAAYSSDGYFGLGFDSDCFFFDNGIILTVETGSPFPEPTTMLLIGPGLVGLSRLRNRFQRH